MATFTFLQFLFLFVTSVQGGDTWSLGECQSAIEQLQPLLEFVPLLQHLNKRVKVLEGKADKNEQVLKTQMHADEAETSVHYAVDMTDKNHSPTNGASAQSDPDTASVSTADTAPRALPGA